MKGGVSKTQARRTRSNLSPAVQPTKRKFDATSEADLLPRKRARNDDAEVARKNSEQADKV